MGIKGKIRQALFEFLSFEAGAAVRNQPSQKERKYKNIQITQDFKRIDNQRKLKRLETMAKHKKLLQQQLSNESKLLTQAESQIVTEEIKNLQRLIQKQQNEIDVLEEQIEQLQADYMVVEGATKLGVLNHIQYLIHMNTYNPGFVLHPETIKTIENVHYCVNHNLPVNRIKLYEIMPDYFEKEIGQLEEATQRYIIEKEIYSKDEQGSMSFFQGQDVTIYKNQKQAEIHALLIEQRILFDNMQDYAEKLLTKHVDLIQKVERGQTPFRNVRHFASVLLSDLPINYLPEEEALQKDVDEIERVRAQWLEYDHEVKQQIIAIRTRREQPPPYVLNHPVLKEKWEQLMEQMGNPYDLSSLIPEGDPKIIERQTLIRKRIRQVVAEKFDPVFVEQMNKDRSLIDKKKMEIDFYNTTTTIMEEIQLLGKKSEEEEIFQKLPKSKLIRRKKGKNCIPMNAITRMMFLNNQNPTLYTLDFFSQWFGVEKTKLEQTMKFISYIQVPPQPETQTPKINILKFQL